MTRVVCAGHVNWDVTLSVDSLPGPDGEAVITDQSQSGGGSAANTAMALRGLDRDARLVGSVGDDQHGRLVEEELRAADVDCTHLERVQGQTTVKYLVVDREGQLMVLANDGVNEALRPADVPASALDAVAHLHLTSQRPETARYLAETATGSGVSVSFDPGRRIGNRNYRDVFDCVDVLLLNEEEAETAREAGILDEYERTVVVKRGARGAEIRTGDRTVTHPGFDVEPVDTTGAGDAFAAGFLTAWLDDATARETLTMGNACGALAVQSCGAQTQLTWDALGPYLGRDQ